MILKKKSIACQERNQHNFDSLLNRKATTKSIKVRDIPKSENERKYKKYINMFTILLMSVIEHARSVYFKF